MNLSASSGNVTTNMAKGGLKGSTLRGAIAGTCGIAFLVCSLSTYCLALHFAIVYNTKYAQKSCKL